METYLISFGDDAWEIIEIEYEVLDTHTNKYINVLYISNVMAKNNMLSSLLDT